VLSAGRSYARRITRVAVGEGTRLIGHAYARYLGDLSGGQILARLLGRSLGLGPGTLAFYDFPDIPDADGFKAELRAALDWAAPLLADPEAVVDEALCAFRLNIALSEAVEAAAAPAGGRSAVVV
jgi:heme oxygenase